MRSNLLLDHGYYREDSELRNAVRYTKIRQMGNAGLSTPSVEGVKDIGLSVAQAAVRACCPRGFGTT